MAVYGFSVVCLDLLLYFLKILFVHRLIFKAGIDGTHHNLSVTLHTRICRASTRRQRSLVVGHFLHFWKKNIVFQVNVREQVISKLVQFHVCHSVGCARVFRRCKIVADQIELNGRVKAVVLDWPEQCKVPQVKF